MPDKNNEAVKTALVQADLSNPVQNIVELTDHIFSVVDSFNADLSAHDLQLTIGKFKKYHEFNKLLLKNLNNSP